VRHRSDHRGRWRFRPPQPAVRCAAACHLGVRLLMDARASVTWITPLDPDDAPQARPDGIRVALKDCFDLEGIVTTAGSPVIAEHAEPASADARCMAGLRSDGARFVGKANLHELCFGS